MACACAAMGQRLQAARRGHGHGPARAGGFLTMYRRARSLSDSKKRACTFSQFTKDCFGNNAKICAQSRKSPFYRTDYLVYW